MGSHKPNTAVPQAGWQGMVWTLRLVPGLKATLPWPTVHACLICLGEANPML